LPTGKNRTQSRASPGHSVQIFPGRRTVEEADSRGLDCAGFEISRVDAHLAVFLGLDSLPVGDAAASAASDELQGLIAPCVFIGRARCTDDADFRSFVICPQRSVAPADRAV